MKVTRRTLQDLVRDETAAGILEYVSLAALMAPAACRDSATIRAESSRNMTKTSGPNLAEPDLLGSALAKVPKAE
jgi:hypothetical protein